MIYLRECLYLFAERWSDIGMTTRIAAGTLGALLAALSVAGAVYYWNPDLYRSYIPDTLWPDRLLRDYAADLGWGDGDGTRTRTLAETEARESSDDGDDMTEAREGGDGRAAASVPAATRVPDHVRLRGCRMYNRNLNSSYAESFVQPPPERDGEPLVGYSASWLYTLSGIRTLQDGPFRYEGGCPEGCLHAHIGPRADHIMLDITGFYGENNRAGETETIHCLPH